METGVYVLDRNALYYVLPRREACSHSCDGACDCTRIKTDTTVPVVSNIVRFNAQRGVGGCAPKKHRFANICIEKHGEKKTD